MFPHAHSAAGTPT